MSDQRRFSAEEVFETFGVTAQEVALLTAHEKGLHEAEPHPRCLSARCRQRLEELRRLDVKQERSEALKRIADPRSAPKVEDPWALKEPRGTEAIARFMLDQMSRVECDRLMEERTNCVRCNTVYLARFARSALGAFYDLDRTIVDALNRLGESDPVDAVGILRAARGALEHVRESRR